MSKHSLRDGIYQLFRYNAVAFVLRLLTSIVAARVLGPDQMGGWLLLSLIPTYAEGFGRFKADVAAIYILPQGRWNLGEVSVAVNVIAALSSLPIVVALLAFEPWVIAWLFGSTAMDVIWYRLVVLLIPLQFHVLAYSYLILHLEDVRAYNVQNVLRVLLPAALAAVLLLTTPLRLGALVFSSLLGAVAGLVYSAMIVHRRAAAQRPRQPGLYRSLLSFGRRLYVAGAIEHLNQYLASLLVGLHLAPRELACFRLGQDRLQVLDQVTSSMNTLLFPRIAREANAGAQIDIMARSSRVLLLLLTVAAVIGGVLTPAIVWLLYGREYMPMIWSIWLLLPGVVALGATSPATQYFMGCGKPQLIWKLAIAPLIMQVSLLSFAIGQWGFRGAALVVSVSFIAHAAARLLLLRHTTARRVRALILPTADDVAMVRSFIGERIRRLTSSGGRLLHKDVPRA